MRNFEAMPGQMPSPEQTQSPEQGAKIYKPAETKIAVDQEQAVPAKAYKPAEKPITVPDQAQSPAKKRPELKVVRKDQGQVQEQTQTAEPIPAAEEKAPDPNLILAEDIGKESDAAIAKVQQEIQQKQAESNIPTIPAGRVALETAGMPQEPTPKPEEQSNPQEVVMVEGQAQDMRKQHYDNVRQQTGQRYDLNIGMKESPTLDFTKAKANRDAKRAEEEKKNQPAQKTSFMGEAKKFIGALNPFK